MSITAKATLFWDSTDSEGWSESFYMTAADITAARSAMDTVIANRLDLAFTTFRLVYARVSDVAIKGDSLVSALNYPLFGTYAPTGPGIVALEANCALDCQLFATSAIKNRTFLRGLSSDVINGRAYMAPSGWDANFTVWATSMISHTVVARHRISVGPPPTYNYTAVTALHIIGATARKPGRPFGLPRGRR